MSTNIPNGEGADLPSVETRILKPNESVTMLLDPLLSPTPELARRAEPYGRVMAEIDAGDKTFAVIDLSRLDGNNNESIKYALIDHPRVQDGHVKGMLLLSSDFTQTIGRAHQNEHFDYTQIVSNDHFTIRYEGNKLIVTNLEPTNVTMVTGMLDPGSSVYTELKTRKLPDRRERWYPLEVENLEKISPARSEGILQQAEIHGDRFLGQKLTVEILRQEGLEPKYVVELQDDVHCYLSDPYDIGDGRIAAVGYVDTPQGIVARTYYRSNSQGTWRYLPKYQLKGNRVVWYDKGFSEESILLPSKLQSALAKISSKDKPVLTERDSDFIFAGTARDITNRAPGTLVAEVNKRPIVLNPDFCPTREKAPSPESIVLTYPQSPNFTVLLDSWEQPSELYGTIKTDVYESNDKTLRYIFCNDEYGRAWIGGVETDADIGSIGLKSAWINAGMLTTPAYEYPGYGYGYENYNLRRDVYVDMFENYISKIPVIQDYLRTNRQQA